MKNFTICGSFFRIIKSETVVKRFTALYTVSFNEGSYPKPAQNTSMGEFYKRVVELQKRLPSSWQSTNMGEPSSDKLPRQR